MSIVAERFDSKEERDTRLNELRLKGHRPMKGTDTIPVAWKTVYELRYSPQMRRRRRK